MNTHIYLPKEGAVVCPEDISFIETVSSLNPEPFPSKVLVQVYMAKISFKNGHTVLLRKYTVMELYEILFPQR